MISCVALKGNGQVRVTFAVAADGRGPISVVGDFNRWDPAANPMVRRGGTAKGAVVLDAGRRYAFRYLTTRGEWFNDEAAHDYQSNGFGDDDGVVDLTSAP